MALPGGITTITVTGQFTTPSGTPASGTISFTPSSTLTDRTGMVILTANPVVAVLNSSGEISVVLPCTDNTTLVPNPWQYNVVQSVSFATQTYQITLPSTLGPTVDLSSLAPIPSQPSPINGIYVISVNGQSGSVTLDAGGIIPPAGDIGGTSGSPTVVSTHLAAPLPVAQGGTAAASAGAALTSLGAASTVALTAETARAEAAEALALPLAGGTMSGPIAMGTHGITGVTNGVAATDVAAFGQFANLPTPAQMGIVAWNYPSLLATGALVAAASGVVYLLKIPLYGASITVTNILIGVSVAASSATSNENFVGLYDNNGTKIGGSADQTVAWGSAGVKTAALSGGSFTGTWPFVYAVVVANASGSNPQFSRASGGTIGVTLIALNATATNLPFSTNGSGAVALPGSLTYASNSATGSQSIWVGLS